MWSAIRLGLGSVFVVASGAMSVWLASDPGPDEATSKDIVDAVPGGFVHPDQLHKYRELTQRQQAAMARVALKMEAATDLIHGRVTFSEAAARFREIILSDPVDLAFVRLRFPTATDEERHYRNVIGFVRGLARTAPESVPALVERLEAEVRVRFSVTEKDDGVPTA